MIAHLVSCSIVALAALAATALLRGRHAAWRYTILFLALLRFALPTAWLNQAGSALVRVVPARPPAQDLRWLLNGPGIGDARGGVSGKPAGLPYRALWIAGSAICLLLWLRRAIRRIPAVRAATDLECRIFRRAAQRASLRLRIVAADLEPGAWGWLRPCVIFPDGLSAHLTAAELESVMLHEIAHVRRRDNLTAAVAHAIASVFWFHPLVWWLERRLLAERETACDEAVLRAGARSEDYAAGILKACRMPFDNAAGYAGATGSNLQRRLEYIMRNDAHLGFSNAIRMLQAASLAVAILLPVAGGYLRAQEQLPAATSPSKARYQEGVSLLAQKKYAEAEETFRDARRLDPSNTQALLAQAEAMWRRGTSNEALQLLQETSAENPSRWDLRLALGNMAVRVGEYDLALSTFHAMLAGIEPDSKGRGDLYLRIGETYRRKGDLESAVANLRKAAEALPDNNVAAATLALVLDGAGKTEEAKAQYLAVLQRDPNNVVGMNNLAYLLSEQGDVEEALSLALRAKEIMPDLDEVADTVGWIYLKKKNTDQAVRAFEALVRKTPGNSTFHYHLAMAYHQKGDKTAAIDQLKAALEANPRASEVDQIRRLMENLSR